VPNRYTNLGRGLENYFAVTHPSQPNYFALTGGDYFNHDSDSPFNINQTSIVDLLEGANLTWKSYMEDYPGNCDTSSSVSKYYRKHNPYANFVRIVNCLVVLAFQVDRLLVSWRVIKWSVCVCVCV
jgi:hypothetical protein